MAEKKRLGWIDLAKAIAFVMVVFGHTLVPGSRLRAIIYSFHMPLFFILSGYTFSKKPMKVMVASSAKRLLLPYALFYFAVTVIPTVMIWTTENRLQRFFELLQSFIFVAGDGQDIAPAGAVWFLIALFLARIILNASLHFFDNRRVAFPIQGFLCGVLAIMGYLLGSVFRIWLPLCPDIAMVAVFFMWCGHSMRMTELFDRRINPPLYLIPLAFWIIEIWTGLPGWNQPLSMVGRTYLAFPLPIIGSVGASFLFIKVCKALETAATSKPHNIPLSRVLQFAEYLGRSCMRLYIIHCLDFVFRWSSIDVPLFGSTSLAATIARLAFDVLVLLLFEVI